MSRPRVLVAGVGNVFLGDDAFGVEVAQRLLRRGLPDEVRVVDFGIRGLDLTYALLDGYEAVVLVDAAPRGESPGTLYVLELPRDAPPPEGAAVEAHDLDPAKVLRLAAAMGGQVGRLFLVGCEPAPAAGDEMTMGLSEPVRAAVAEAVSLVESMVARPLNGGGPIMSQTMSENEARLIVDEGRDRYELADRDRGGLSPGLMLAGLAAVGLGVLAWYYLGPDLVRYMKIRNM